MIIDETVKQTIRNLIAHPELKAVTNPIYLNHFWKPDEFTANKHNSREVISPYDDIGHRARGDLPLFEVILEHLPNADEIEATKKLFPEQAENMSVFTRLVSLVGAACTSSVEPETACLIEKAFEAEKAKFRYSPRELLAKASLIAALTSDKAVMACSVVKLIQPNSMDFGFDLQGNFIKNPFKRIGYASMCPVSTLLWERTIKNGGQYSIRVSTTKMDDFDCTVADMGAQGIDCAVLTDSYGNNQVLKGLKKVRSIRDARALRHKSIRDMRGFVWVREYAKASAAIRVFVIDGKIIASTVPSKDYVPSTQIEPFSTEVATDELCHSKGYREFSGTRIDPETHNRLLDHAHVVNDVFGHTGASFVVDVYQTEIGIAHDIFTLGDADIYSLHPSVIHTAIKSSLIDNINAVIKSQQARKKERVGHGMTASKILELWADKELSQSAEEITTQANEFFVGMNCKSSVRAMVGDLMFEAYAPHPRTLTGPDFCLPAIRGRGDEFGDLDDLASELDYLLNEPEENGVDKTIISSEELSQRTEMYATLNSQWLNQEKKTSESENFDFFNALLEDDD